MDKDANLAGRPEQKPRSPGILGLLLAVIFFVLVLLLGLSMVHHRFFRGQRIHQNGSLGQ
ncbi:MAG: hypothetical protein WBE03_10965 [Terracidiphilus sp.]